MLARDNRGHKTPKVSLFVSSTQIRFQLVIDESTALFTELEV